MVKVTRDKSYSPLCRTAWLVAFDLQVIDANKMYQLRDSLGRYYPIPTRDVNT